VFAARQKAIAWFYETKWQKGEEKAFFAKRSVHAVATPGRKATPEVLSGGARGDRLAPSTRRPKENFD
jgi:hypothetical protein